VFDTAWPANKSDCTPLSCCCQLLWSVERKIVPESSRAQYTEPSGDETSTERDAAGEAVGALAIPAVAPAAGAMAGAAGVSDTTADSLAIPDLTCALPVGKDLPLASSEGAACALADGVGLILRPPREAVVTL